MASPTLLNTPNVSYNSSAILNSVFKQFGTVASNKKLVNDQDAAGDEDASPADESQNLTEQKLETIRKNFKGKVYKPADLASSLDYLNSEVYQTTYRGKPVWFYYRRNFKGHFPPPYTRRNCVVKGQLISSNPCPICRDEYLILHHKHTELLKQFINPISSEILEPSITGLCQHQHKILLLEIEKARDLGTLEMWIPFYLYNYSDYYRHLAPDHLEALVKASGGHVLPNPTHEPVSSAHLACLPPDILDLLKSTQIIPHASEFKTKLADLEIERPKVPNRYQMEEDYKKRVLKLKRARSLGLMG